jgi:hypothetical protein
VRPYRTSSPAAPELLLCQPPQADDVSSGTHAGWLAVKFHNIFLITSQRQCTATGGASAGKGASSTHCVQVTPSPDAYLRTKCSPLGKDKHNAVFIIVALLNRKNTTQLPFNHPTQGCRRPTGGTQSWLLSSSWPQHLPHRPLALTAEIVWRWFTSRAHSQAPAHLKLITY